MKKILPVIISFCILLSSCSNFKKTKSVTLLDIKQSAENPIRVLFDTDLGNDIDDVLALQMLLNYHKQGKINLLGISISKANPLTIEYIDGFCNYNGLPNMSLGYVYKGAMPEDGNYLRQTLETVVDGEKILKPQRSVSDSIPEGYKFLRRMLVSQPDQSVVLVVVGQETNISRLLKSKADEYSDLNGVDLVRKKVKFISIMGGHFGSNAFPEWNIKTDLESAQLVFSLCPVPVIASGYEIGDALLYPHTSIQNDFSNPEKNPLCVSYYNWGHMPYDRQTWDLTSVLVAVEPGEEYFSYSPCGTITIDSEGNSVFTQNEKGKHRYLILDSSNAESVVNKLVRVVTSK